jgi:hypothetical protein
MVRIQPKEISKKASSFLQLDILRLPFFQVLLNDGSKVLSKAFDGKVFFKEVTLVVPNSWYQYY